MRIENFDEKRNSFKMLLFKLSVSQMTLSSSREKSKIYQELEQIYSKPAEFEDFRHFYSDIFAVLSLIDKDPSLGDMDILGQNMDIVRKGYQPKTTDSNGKLINITKQINKLYDHINLEIARMNYFKKNETRTERELLRVSDTLTEVKDNVKQMEKAVDKVDEMQKQYVTILGIFASIVLAFVGGITFSTSVLQNINSASIYRLILVIDLLAFVLVNVIWLLLSFVSEINDKTIKTFRLKWFNIACVVVTALIIVAWVLNVQAIADFLYGLLPWCK